MIMPDHISRGYQINCLKYLNIEGIREYCKAEIYKAGFKEDYEKDGIIMSLPLVGYPKESLIIRVKDDLSDSTLFYTDKEEIEDILYELSANAPSNLEGKVVEVLTEKRKIIGQRKIIGLKG